jgi:hypothetical protein
MGSHHLAVGRAAVVIEHIGPEKGLSASLSEQEIRSFFDVPDNFRHVQLEVIFAKIGQPLEYDDWDWGRITYEWIAPGVRMRIVSRGGYAICVEELDPNDTSRFGTALRIVWESSSPSPGPR